MFEYVIVDLLFYVQMKLKKKKFSADDSFRHRQEAQW